MFLQEVYSNEENYEYLKNEFNSKDIGFNHNVKLFKIDFELFDSIIEDWKKFKMYGIKNGNNFDAI